MKMFKARITGARARKGLSQQELADLIGVSLRSVQNWEAGEGEPQGKNLRNLSAALEAPIPFLLGEEDAPRPAPRGESLLRESTGPGELESWKRRALDAEKTLADLRTGLRSLLDLSSSATVPASYVSKPSSKRPSDEAKLLKLAEDAERNLRK